VNEYTPTTNEIRDAYSRDGYGMYCRACGHDYPAEESTEFDRWLAAEKAEARAEGAREALVLLRTDFEEQHRMVEAASPEDGYAGLSWHDWTDGTRNGMERLLYTVRYWIDHPEHLDGILRARAEQEVPRG